MNSSKYLIKAVSIIILLNLCCGYPLEAKLIKPKTGKFLDHIEAKLNQYRTIPVFKLFEFMFLDMGTYHALRAQSQPAVIAGKTFSMAQPEALKIITANLILFPPPFFYDQKERVAGFVKTILPYNPDIVLLQEVWDNESIIELCQYFPEFWITYTPSTPFNPSGLLTLSRFPISKACFLQYPIKPGSNIQELVARKGMLSCTIKLGDMEVLIANSHLYAAPGGQRFRTQFQFKVLQRNFLASKLALLIMGGDMNLTPDHLAELRDPCLVKGTCEKPTAGGYTRTKKLDYIMIRPSEGLKARLETTKVENNGEFSDHDPVFGKIVFE